MSRQLPKHLRITGQKKGVTLITAVCPACHKPDLLEVPAKGLFPWLDGALIQDAFPDLDDTQREQLITGYCQPCWDGLWDDED